LNIQIGQFKIWGAFLLLHKGANIANDAADFSGMNGCYLFQGRDVTERKNADLKDQILVVAPREGLVSSEMWLAVRKKLLNKACYDCTLCYHRPVLELYYFV